MRLRSGFVSNSSSCSFLITKNQMTQDQFLKAKHHLVEETYEGEPYLEVTGWNCHERDNGYCFETSIDNFDMISFIQKMGVEIKQAHHSNSYDKKWKKNAEKAYGIKFS